MKFMSIGLIGISGVGKSTFIRNVQSHCSIEHISASEVIQSELFQMTGRMYTPKQMRERDIDDNQAALISGFQKMRLRRSIPLVLDAHTIIDKDGLLVPIKPSVFAEFEFDLLICLTAPAFKIKEQRANDKLRKRPELSIEELESHQDLSKRQAIEIGKSLGVPLFVLSSGDELKMVRLIYPNFMET